MLRKVINFARTGVLFVIKWRYLIAFIIFILCVVFKVHGSSIAEYNNFFTNSEEYNSESLVIGNSRGIRSDEWLVHTPYYLSQNYNDYEKDSHLMSLEGQDMIIGYNAPVLNITLLGKPFTWGYILLGNEYGLSWYWCSKLILLVLLSFELCMIITRKNKKLSLLGALLIAFAPLVQWWFVPHMVDVFFWGMAILVLAYHFFTSTKWLRLLCMILLPLSMVTFAIALFPSLQIPVALVSIALLVAFLIRDKKLITFKKKDIWRIVIMATYVLGVLGYTFITSREAIMALFHTAYPGNRVINGGNFGLEALFTDPVTFTLPFKDITYENNCEISNFIHFAPLFLILYPFIWKKMKRDRNIIVGNVLIASIGVMALFMLIGFPSILAKLTFFSYINRMDIAYGFVATIFTIWGISMIWKKNIFTKKQILLALASYALLYFCLISPQRLTYLHFWQYLIIITGISFLVYLMLTNRQKLFILFTTLLIVVSGLTINPLARGVSPLYAHPLEQKIAEIVDNDKDAYWVAVNDNRLASIGIANGARMLNATNFYPDYGKWQLVDPGKIYDEIYNRYAHIVIQLTDEETQFHSGSSADAFSVDLSYNDLLKWPVKYLLVSGDLEGGYDQYYRKIYDDTEGNYHIYERAENGN